MRSCPMVWFANLMSAIGAINWGLAAFLRFNLVEYIASILPIPYLNMIVYGVVAIGGIYSLVFLFTQTCTVCK